MTLSQPDPAEELEALDDRICDFYSGQDNGIIYHKMDAEAREATREFLDKWLQDFRLWRDKNGFNYEPHA